MAKKQAKKPAAKKPAPKAKPAAKSAAKAKPKAKPNAAAKAAPKAVPRAAPVDDGSKQALAAARADAQRLDAELQAARAETARFAAELKEADRELDAARALANKLEQRLKGPPVAPVDPARAQLDALRPQLDTALEKTTRLEGELKSALAERDRLRAAQGELDKLRAEGLEAAAELAAATRRADDHERERTRLSGELSSLRLELGSYKLRCPKCGKSFVEEQYEGITIDRCSGCDAIYFDAGEVDQLLVRWQEKMAATNASPEGQQQASGWFRNLFKKKVKIAGSDGGEAPPSS